MSQASVVLKRVTLWVRELERSLELYRDVLGLVILEEKTLAGPAIAAMVGLEQARLRIAHLGRPGTQQGWVGLYEIGETAPRTMAALPKVETFPLYGQSTLVFEVSDVAAICAKLSVLPGVTVLVGPSHYHKIEASEAMPAGHYSELIFRDADGTIVSLLSYRPG